MNIRHSVMTNEFKHNKYSTFSETLNEQNNCANNLYVDKSKKYIHVKSGFAPLLLQSGVPGQSGWLQSFPFQSESHVQCWSKREQLPRPEQLSPTPGQPLSVHLLPATMNDLILPFDAKLK